MTTTVRRLALLRPAARILTGSTCVLLRSTPCGRRARAPIRMPWCARVSVSAGDEPAVRGNAAVQVLGCALLALS
jgi:hypothetical protein